MIDWVRRRRQLLAYLALVAMMVYGFYLIAEQRQAGCEARNEATTLAVGAGAEALIETFPNASSATVEQYRRNVEKQARKVEVEC